ncbi:TDG/mug DNA glycosylase family protein [Propionibacterium cyclohexanicum]|uniref:TDG/mug DNA glycosylase family protein n=1 Tax=Propionibacterium cyclohexanicum TaxID=64702 RepID=A0A1H9SF39_9ACTN|nr:mismatch-specific DNA-glycosylase [Propionibacterium cyclohexanicum]SER83646.1 TDG/mug DNA glycosylase family protein [Propionibacterium cyclohexanicum]
MRFTRAELESFRGAMVPDVLPDPLRLLLVGINPSLLSAAVGAHFARPGNRFYPALAAAGIISRAIDVSSGWTPQAQAEFDRTGVGITNLVPQASVRADELSRAQLRAGAESLARLVSGHHPKVVAVLGVTAYRQGFGRPHAAVGEQPESLSWYDGSGASRLFVLPNPSGLNAHETVASLAHAYGEAADAAGIVRRPVGSL